MPLKVAIQMDPVSTIHIDNDTTFALALEAQRRGHELFHYLPSALSLDEGKLFANAQPVKFQRDQKNPATLGAKTQLELGNVDVVLMRQDPPFDMAYITATHLLEHLQPNVLVVNDPAGVRNAPEKLLVTQFPDLSPPTLITSDQAVAQEFRERHGDVVVKPLYASGGGGVFHIKPADENFSSALEMLAKHYQAPFIVQKYLPEIREGDKRILLIEGEPIGVAIRIPASGEARANLHAGGRSIIGTLTARDQDICARIGPTLRAMGLVLAGIDVIGDWLTEINVTSPTLMQQIGDDHGAAAAALFWDAMEARRKALH